MHKRLVSGCSLDVAKNSDLYLEQFISSSDRLLKWECFISLYCWVPWDLLLKQIRFHLAEEDEKGGLNSVTAACTNPQCWLTLLPLESDRSWCKVCFLNHHPLSEGIDSLNTISVVETNVNSFALLLLTANELCETQQKGVTSLWFCQGSKVELHVGMKPCLIRFCNYFDTILAEACSVKQFLVQCTYYFDFSCRFQDSPNTNSITIYYHCTLIIYKYASSNVHCVLICFYLGNQF